jgi:hypothetical protein
MELDVMGWDWIGLDWIGACTVAFWDGSPVVYAPGCWTMSFWLGCFTSVHVRTYVRCYHFFLLDYDGELRAINNVHLLLLHVNITHGR